MLATQSCFNRPKVKKPKDIKVCYHMWHRTAAILHIKKKKRGASSNPGATLFDWFSVKLAETLKKVMGSLVLVMSSRGQNSAALMLRTHSVLYQPGFLLLRLPQHLLHLFYPLGLQPTGTTTHRGKECVMTRLRQGWKKSQQTCSLGTKHWERKKKGDGDKGFLMNSSKLSSVTLLLGEVGADLSVPMETEPVSHLSGVQAELPVETLVSMLSELSRLRVSYAWLPLGGSWWCRMEWWTVGDRSVQGDSCHRLTVPSTDGAES